MEYAGVDSIMWHWMETSRAQASDTASGSILIGKNKEVIIKDNSFVQRNWGTKRDHNSDKPQLLLFESQPRTATLGGQFVV